MSQSRSIALGEVALRVNDLPAMETFYENVVGLELMRRFPVGTCFKIADGANGHTQIVFLFKRSDDYVDIGDTKRSAIQSATTTLDHLALSVSKEDFFAEKERLEALDCEIKTAEHVWVQWRSLYIADPEGNVVEFVCHDPDIAPEATE